MITQVERLARLRLARSDNVGPVTYRALMSRFGSAVEALERLPDLAKRGGARANITIATATSAERELAAIEKAGAHLLIWNVAPYPTLLARTEDAPPILIMRGHSVLFDKPAIGIVGARNASAAGLRIARELAAGLSAEGMVVVSGLARGIDSAAHRAALTDGTIAAVAGGIDVPYPPENEALYKEIAALGMIVGEQPLGTIPQGRHFPRRNRIISGLSLGTVIVEAALKSGSLITARFAAEQGREVMAVPGSPLDPRAQGCNQLIREGATLVQSVADILEAVRGMSGGLNMASPELPFADGIAAPADPLEVDRQRILELLTPTPVLVDELIQITGFSPATVHMILLELDLSGRLVRSAGHKVAILDYI